MMSGVPFWIAERFGDRRAQWFGKNMPRAHNMWSVMWYRPEIEEDVPASGPQLYHSALDWVVARTGYAAEDLVVAMRSGGPSNHEHADRNGIIVKCFGEPLVVDPYRPPYSYSDPSWMLRTTAGHSCLLINGAGHQYHDGSEGTNASDARAHIVRIGERSDHIFWCSDATDAYRLVDERIASVVRSVVVLPDLPAVLVLDKVVCADGAELTARHYAFNGDDGALLETNGSGFAITRPAARIEGAAWAAGGIECHAGTLPIPEERAVQHPFVDVKTTAPAPAPLLVTALVPRKTDAASKIMFETAGEATVEVTIEADGRRAVAQIFDSGRIPEFAIG
jgi:hypothetical protein